MKPIYLDYAAATPVRREVRQEMRKTEGMFVNPSSVHTAGVSAREVLDEARGRMGRALGWGDEDKIIFTSGGTESINLAVLGVARANKHKGKHIITSAVEHKAVLETCKQLEREGFVVDYVKVDNFGRISVENVRRLLRKDTILVSIQYVNNETGMIQPIVEIGRLLAVRGKVGHKVVFHTDACQAGLLELDVNKLNVDLLTLNSSKVYGPHGMGLLYVREGVKIKPLFFGGGQEYGLRSGTENVNGIVGFTLALSLLQRERKNELKRLEGLRKKFVSDLSTKIDDVVIVSDLVKSVSTILSAGFRGVEAEIVVKSLSAQGIYISAGSACTAQQIEVSHVLKAMEVEEDVALGTVRFSFGRETTWRDLQRVVSVVTNVIGSLRKI